MTPAVLAARINLSHWLPPIVVTSHESSTALDHLDPVSVRIGDEKETRDCGGLVLQIAYRPGRQARLFEPRVFRVNGIDGDGEMTIAVTKLIGLAPVEIDRQFQFEGRGRVAEVDESKPIEAEAIDKLQSESASVEVQRTFLVEHANHRVDGFGHSV